MSDTSSFEGKPATWRFAATVGGLVVLLSAVMIYFRPHPSERHSTAKECARVCAPIDSYVKQVRLNPHSNDTFRNRVQRNECFCGAETVPRKVLPP